jgi:hypothetical protein
VNLLATIPITYISSLKSLPAGYLSVTIKPLPGALTNWNEVSPGLFINPATPTNMLGQLDAVGNPLFAILWMCVAALSVIADKIAARAAAPIRGILGTLLVALSLAAFLQYSQYSMRAGLRFQYAAVVLSVIAVYVPRLRLGNTRLITKSSQ